MNYNDFELIYMVCDNEEALAVLMKKYEPLFKKLSYSFAKKYVSKGVDFEDLMQHCRITFCKVIDKYDYNSDVLFYSYLLICLRGAMFNFTRNYNKKLECFSYMDNEDYENFNEFVSDINIYDEYNDYDYQRKIIDFKYSLSFFDMQVFELRYNSFSYGEIADLLDVNKKKVDNTLLKIRKKMEKYFLFS